MRLKFVDVLFVACILIASLACSRGIAAGGGGRGGKGGHGGGNMPEPTKPMEPLRVNPFTEDAEPVAGTENRLKAMEIFIFGHDQKTLRDDQRLKQLEKRLIPWVHDAAKQDMDKRVERLWGVLATANHRAGKQD